MKATGPLGKRFFGRKREEDRAYSKVRYYCTTCKETLQEWHLGDQVRDDLFRLHFMYVHGTDGGVVGKELM